MEATEDEGRATSLSRRSFLGGVGGAAIGIAATSASALAREPASAAGLPDQRNLVINPSFELGPPGSSVPGWTLA